jgi:hypothetical protein
MTLTSLSALISNGTLAVRVRLPTQELFQRPPCDDAIHLAFLLDTSGSMNGEPLSRVKRTLHAARPLLQLGDRVTLITFSTAATVVVDNLLMDADGDTVLYTAIDQLVANGSTNMAAAFDALGALHLRLDAVVLLTDGMVNIGIKSTEGLRALASGLGTMPFYTLGYGADHNRLLLQQLATNSRGSYTYIRDEMTLPEIMGDIISGLRFQVYSRASLRVPGGLCKELGFSGERYMIGSVIPGRDYWAVFDLAGDGDEYGERTVGLYNDTDLLVDSIATFVDNGNLEVEEQILRCKVAVVLEAATAALEEGHERPSSLAELCAAIDAMPPALKERPLVSSMRTQLEQIRTLPTTLELLARMSSDTAYLSTQRGVSSGYMTFSSPAQRNASDTTQILYSSQRTEDPI